MSEKKTRTTIRVSERVLKAVKASGVGNVSSYTENLWKEDLKRQAGRGKKEKEILQRIDERLDKLEDEWRETVKKLGREA